MLRFAAAILLIGLAGAAQASQPGVQTLKNWRAMDLCAKQAQAAFPDFTPEANAQREARLKECLAGQNLPPREPAGPGR